VPIPLSASIPISSSAPEPVPTPVVAPKLPRTYATINNTDYPGQGDIKNAVFTTLDDCKNTCDNISNCIGFVTTNNDKKCHFKSIVQTPTINNNTTYYYTGNAPSTTAPTHAPQLASTSDPITVPPSKQSRIYATINNTDYPGQGDIKNAVFTTLDDCKNTCDNISNCIGFVTTNNDKKCHFKSIVQTPTIDYNTNYYYTDSTPAVVSSSNKIDKVLQFCKDNQIMIGASIGVILAKKALSTVINNISKKILNKSLTEVLDSQIKKIASSIADTITNKIKSSIQILIKDKISSKVTKNVLDKIASKVATKATEKASALAAKEVLKKAATTAAKAAAQRAASTGVKLAGKIATGPIGWGSALFDATSMGLDAADIGTDFTGFQHVANNKDIDEIQKMAKNTFISEFQKVNIDIPINGPLNNLDDNTLSEARTNIVTELINNIYAEYLNLSNDYVSKIDKNSQPYNNLSDDEFTEAIKQIYDNNITHANEVLDSPDFNILVESQLCSKYDGIYVNNKCSYKDAMSCNAHNNPPDNYYEFVNGICTMQPYAAKDICNKNNLEYIYDKQHCKITDLYCGTKGQDYKQDNDGTCYSNIGTSILTAIFGDTIGKGIKKIFDTDYTYPRETHVIKTTLADTKNRDSYQRQSSCPADRELVGDLCSLKCPDGYNHDSGATCTRPYRVQNRNPKPMNVRFSWNGIHTSCDNGKQEDAGLCSDPCNDGFDRESNSVCHQTVQTFNRKPITKFDFLENCRPGYSKVDGTDRCIRDCDPGYIATGPATCTKPVQTYCDDASNFEIFGAACYRKCKQGYESKGTQCTLTKCPDGYYMNNDKICVSNQ
jgi:hypothetical protein